MTTKIKIWSVLFSVLVYSGLQAQYNDNRLVDSLEQVLKSGKFSDTELIHLYYDLSKSYGQHNPEKEKEHANKGISLSKKSDYTEILPELYYNLAEAYFSMGRYDSAEIHYQTLVKKTEDDEIKFRRLRIQTFIDIGTLYNIQGKTPEAMIYYFRALDIAEKNGLKHDISNIYANLGQIYLTMENFEQSEIYFIRMKNLCSELNDSLSMAYALDGLTEIHLHNKNYSQALECAEMANRIVSHNVNALPSERMTGLLSLAVVWFEGFHDDDKALEYAKQALTFAEMCSHALYISLSLCQISSIYLHQGKYIEAEQTALQAFDADSASFYINTVLHENIAKANIMMGNKTKALEYFDRHKQWMNVYSNKNYQLALTEIEVKYETEKKDLELKAMKKQTRLMVWLSISGCFVLLLSSIALLFLWRLSIQKKRLAEQKVKQLEQEKQLIATQAVLDGETAERTRLARDLHDGLGGMLTAVKYNLNDMMKGVILENADVACFNNALNMLDDSIGELRRVAHHMMPESLSRYGLKPAISDFCNSIPVAKFTYYGDETRVDAKLEVMIYRIIHELVNNALKHSGASDILVQIVQDSDSISLIVQDNGCGFDISAESKGMGLQNIRSRVESYKGVMLIDSRKGEGTEINVEFNLIV